MSKSLTAFLADKPLYYKEIDHERVHNAYAMLKPHIRRPGTVHIVGTNGKGSTGRILACLAYRSGLSVGHFSSPHILKFNERIWINGADASDAVLEAAHRRLYGILGENMSEGLSYFEYTTLLAFVVFEHCDLMVLEAGLGGEYDATNVCDKELSIITPIGIDHQAFLGETIEEIAATKIRSIQTKALIAPQSYPEVLEVAKRVAEEKGAVLRHAQEPQRGQGAVLRHAQEPQRGQVIHDSSLRDKSQITLRHVQEPDHAVAERVEAKGWPDYLLQNASVAMEALDMLQIPYDPNDLNELALFGRFYPLAENIRIDVGHNPLAARAIVEAMEPETVLLYNSLDDKDYEAVLRTLKPKIKRVEIIPIDSQRAVTLEAIEAVLKKLEIPYRFFPNETDEREQYLVFGSFYTVEAFLRRTGFQK